MHHVIFVVVKKWKLKVQKTALIAEFQGLISLETQF